MRIGAETKAAGLGQISAGSSPTTEPALKAEVDGQYTDRFDPSLKRLEAPAPDAGALEMARRLGERIGSDVAGSKDVDAPDDTGLGAKPPEGSPAAKRPGAPGFDISTEDGRTVIQTGDADDEIRVGRALDDGLNVTVNGETAHLTPEEARDVEIRAGGGDDIVIVDADVEQGLTIRGESGDDEILGGGGDDTLDGGAGDDFIAGGAGRDTIRGREGADGILGGSGDDYIDGGEGDDVLDGAEGDDRIDGGTGADEIWGSEGDDRLSGGTGDDRIHGNEGDDVISGNEGDDRIWGSEGDDDLSGQEGDDTIFGNEGDDVIRGQQGVDDIWGGEGDDRIEGGAGDDDLSGDGGDDIVFDNLGVDDLLNVETTTE